MAGNKLTDIAFEKGGISKKIALLLGAGAIGDQCSSILPRLTGPSKVLYKDGFSAEKGIFTWAMVLCLSDWLPNRSKVMLENFSLI